MGQGRRAESSDHSSFVIRHSSFIWRQAVTCPDSERVARTAEDSAWISAPSFATTHANSPRCIPPDRRTCVTGNTSPCRSVAPFLSLGATTRRRSRGQPIRRKRYRKSKATGASEFQTEDQTDGHFLVVSQIEVA